jgi:hypothetical protein
VTKGQNTVHKREIIRVAQRQCSYPRGAAVWVNCIVFVWRVRRNHGNHTGSETIAVVCESLQTLPESTILLIDVVAAKTGIEAALTRRQGSTASQSVV